MQSYVLRETIYYSIYFVIFYLCTVQDSYSIETHPITAYSAGKGLGHSIQHLLAILPRHVFDLSYIMLDPVS